jgi:hypothetical protein
MDVLYGGLEASPGAQKSFLEININSSFEKGEEKPRPRTVSGIWLRKRNNMVPVLKCFMTYKLQGPETGEVERAHCAFSFATLVYHISF